MRHTILSLGLLGLLLGGCQLSLREQLETSTRDSGPTDAAPTDSGRADASGAADGGQAVDGSSSVCRELGPIGCAHHPECRLATCQSCDGERVDLCYGDDEAPPECPSCCSQLGQRECEGSAECRPFVCDACGGGFPVFRACLGPNDPPPGCPGCVRCGGLDEQSCEVEPGCRPTYCNPCGNESVFQGCLGENEQAPPCGPCAGTCRDVFDEATCLEKSPLCQPYSCQDCTTGELVFQACAGPNDPIPGCVPCAFACEFLSETQCASDAVECHPVYGPSANGGMVFQKCVEGRTGICDPMSPPACSLPPPFCPMTHTPSHNGVCWEGCVNPEDCR
ncbi:MAG: hypothetical protein HY791_04015 [Deltaproteobacteria bacterium]|nr:hypothetical protein [Deltaproteobacteria bacterium]